MFNKEKLREIYFDKKQDTFSDAVLNACAGLIYEFVGINPYKEQIKAAVHLAKGDIVNQNTGEGKTISMLFASLLLLRNDRKTFLVTSNDYLSKRDWKYSYNLMNYLNFNSVFVQDSVGLEEYEYKKANIVYATGGALIFDYLRGIKVDYDIALIDEIDYILVESAGTSMSVSDGTSEMNCPVNVYKAILEILPHMKIIEINSSITSEEKLFDLQHEADAFYNPSLSEVDITYKGLNMIASIWGNKNVFFFSSVLSAVIQAKYVLKKDINYTVKGKDICLTDLHSGRSSFHSSFGMQLQTAIEVAENLPVKVKDVFQNTCSLTVFFELFKDISGISGTASYVPYDFSILYGKNVIKINDHYPAQRIMESFYLKDFNEKIAKTLEIIKDTKGAVLIVTSSDLMSSKVHNAINDKLESRKVLLLDNFSIEYEDEMIAQAAKDGTVLISGKIVGRGTDIKSESIEGLTVILFERYMSERAERQVIGRTGRNGHKGRCIILTASDDDIFALSTKKKPKVNENTVKHLQKTYESVQFDGRKHEYIRNKIFLDISKAVERRISQFDNISEIYEYLCISKDENRKLSIMQKKILMHIYMSIRPWFQENYLNYISCMGHLLFSDTGFNNILKEVLRSANETIRATLEVFIDEVKENKEK